MVASDAQKTQYATEHWFREQGLPYFVQPRNRGRRLLARCAPMLLFLALSSFAWSLYAHSSAIQLISDEADSEFDLGPGQAVLLLSMPIAVVLLPVVLAIVGRRVLARHLGWARLVSASTSGRVISASVSKGTVNLKNSLPFSSFQADSIRPAAESSFASALPIW